MISLLLLVKLTIILGIGAVAFVLAPRASAAVRHFLCAVTLGLAVILPLAPQLSIVGEPQVFHLIAQSSTAVAAAHAFTFHWLPAVWLAGIIVVAARFLTGVFYLAWRTQYSTADTGAPLVMGVRVRLADVATPMVWGWIRPTILVPNSFAAWNQQQRRLAILHEVAHIERADNWTVLIGVAACAIYWFHPLVWWLATKLAEQQEIACDDRVLATGVASSTEYASLLVDAARQLSSPALTGCAMVQNKGNFRGRIMHILNFQKSSCSSRWNRFAVLFGVPALLLAGVLIPIRAERTAAAQPTVYKIGRGVTPPKVIYKVEPKYSKETRDAKIQGAVVLRLVINPNGLAQDIHVIRALSPDLDRNAIQALTQWRFQPATKSGLPVFVRATVEVNFRLK